MTRYPLLFMFRNRLDVRGDLVEVTVKGRALAVQEPEGWWMYGVAPGGLAESGDDSLEATVAFRRAFSEILQDIAESVRSIDEFRAEVDDFFTTNGPRETEWWQAVETVRNKSVDRPDLPKEQADSPRGVDVRLIKKTEHPFSRDPEPVLLAA